MPGARGPCFVMEEDPWVKVPWPAGAEDPFVVAMEPWLAGVEDS